MGIDFSQVVNKLAVMMIIIFTGLFAKKARILDENGDKVLTSFVINITSPALIIYSLSSTHSREVFINVYTVVLGTIAIILFTILISALMGHLKGFSKEELLIYRFSVIFGNASFLGIPLCYSIFGKTGLLYASVYGAIQDTFFWTLGAGMMAQGEGEKRLKNMLNPNMIAIFIGFVMLFSGIKLPGFMNDTFSTVGNATTPISLIIVGSGFAAAQMNFKSLKNVLLPGILKLVAVPVIAGCILFLINIDETVRLVLLTELAMPVAASTVMLARKYNRDYSLASKVVMLTTAISMITLPLLILSVVRFL